ncbi:hypothetical protein MKX08_009874 [Trichoderma sp. CBMAI-0020]|nr:hypothetical protein MKX08_009874 [Trichoderma sp. CBMAI-0020]
METGMPLRRGRHGVDTFVLVLIWARMRLAAVEDNDGEPRLATAISTPGTMFAAPVGLLAHEKAEGWGLDESDSGWMDANEAERLPASQRSPGTVQQVSVTWPSTCIRADRVPRVQ